MRQNTLVSINTFNNGSTGQIMRNISQGAISEGYTAYCAYARGNDAAIDSKNDIIIGNQMDVYVHGLYTRITDKTGFASRQATKELITKLGRIQPDIVHLHNLHGYYINIELLFEYLEASSIPVVWTLHDCWSFTGHCAHFTYVKCDKWQTGCSHCPQTQTAYPRSLVDNSEWNQQQKKEIFTSLPKEQIALVTPSEWLAGQVSKSYLNKYPINVINSDIDTSVFKPTPSNFRERYKLGDKTILLGVASTWTPRKGLGDFIELSKLLDSRYQIILVGLNKRQMKALPANVIGIPRTESLSDLAAIYTAADLLLNLSREETQGLTTLEALACGTPAIVYNLAALPEFVENLKTGFIVEATVDAVYEGILQLQDGMSKAILETSALRMSNSQQGCALVKNGACMVSDYLYVYDGLLGK